MHKLKVLPFLNGQMGIMTVSLFLIGLSGGLNNIIYVKCLAHSKCSVNVIVIKY